MARSRIQVAAASQAPSQSAESREYLTLQEAADLLRKGRSTIRLYVREGKLPALQVDGRGPLLFRREDLEAMLVPVALSQQYGEYDPNDEAERSAAIAGIERGLTAQKHRSFEEFAGEQRRKYGLPG
jgi:excisionase family DNA binding protein